MAAQTWKFLPASISRGYYAIRTINGRNKKKRQEMPKQISQSFRNEAYDFKRPWIPADREKRREYYLQNPDQIPLDKFSEGQIEALAKRALHHIIRDGGNLGLD
jgi:hypothetical protein